MQDYRWLGLGAGFPGSGPKVRPFMLNVSKASRLLDEHVDELAWRSASGLQGLYLVLLHESAAAEPVISDEGTDKDGIRTFVVTHDWLQDRFARQPVGAWDVLAVVSTVIATIGEGFGVPLPKLSSGWPGDPDTLAY